MLLAEKMLSLLVRNLLSIVIIERSLINVAGLIRPGSSISDWVSKPVMNFVRLRYSKLLGYWAYRSDRFTLEITSFIVSSSTGNTA